MNVVDTKLNGVVIIEPKVFNDERGFFLETFRQSLYQEIGLPKFVQANHSRSNKNVLRGLHYQMKQPQGKLVRVVRGAVLDIAVDIRMGSPTFGQWESCLLDDVNHRQFYIPPNFAHGFLVLSDIADFVYQCSDYYHGASEESILWSDPDIAIDWGNIDNVILSEKDRSACRLSKKSQAKLPMY